MKTFGGSYIDIIYATFDSLVPPSACKVPVILIKSCSVSGKGSVKLVT